MHYPTKFIQNGYGAAISSPQGIVLDSMNNRALGVSFTELSKCLKRSGMPFDAEPFLGKPTEVSHYEQ